MDFIVEYKLKEGSEAEAHEIRSKFFDSVRATNDSEISYRSLSKPDGLNFVHLARFADEDAFKRFQANPGFKDFADSLPTVCEEGPNASPLTEVHTTEG